MELKLRDRKLGANLSTIYRLAGKIKIKLCVCVCGTRKTMFKTFFPMMNGSIGIDETRDKAWITADTCLSSDSGQFWKDTNHSFTSPVSISRQFIRFRATSFAQ